MKVKDKIREDLEDMKIAEKRIEEMEKEGVITQDADEFLKELEQWAKE